MKSSFTELLMGKVFSVFFWVNTFGQTLLGKSYSQNPNDYYFKYEPESKEERFAILCV